MRNASATLLALLLTVGACGGKDGSEPASVGSSTPAGSASTGSAVGSASGSAATPSVTPSLARGDTAPAFSLEGSDGKTHALADHAGKEVVVVAWFPKAFTGG